MAPYMLRKIMDDVVVCTVLSTYIQTDHVCRDVEKDSRNLGQGILA
jgi:hypothetical protein